MLKVGVVGAGHLGKIHLKLLKQSSKYDLVGFFDSDEKQRKAISKEFGYKAFSDFDELLKETNVIDIVSPTITHFIYAKKSLNAGKHIFLEKPICQTVKEAKEIEFLAKTKDLKGQVGHVERFNPAFLGAKSVINKPKFMECHRLATFNPRGTDVSVVLDLMIHDIDIALHAIDSEVLEVKASGVNVISSTPDIANARISFKNGSVANLTASRISLKNMRKARFFQKNAYISVDFFEKTYEKVEISDADENSKGMIMENFDGVKKEVNFQKPEIKENNAILVELESFADSINNNKETVVSLTDGRIALEVAQEIINIIEPLKT